MHTGSHALWHGIFKDWARRDPPRYPTDSEDSVGGKSILIGHITDSQWDTWNRWMDKGYPVVTMMRHPALALASHFKRNEIDFRWMLWYANQWINHQMMYRRRHPYIIHLDQPELRDAQIRLINDELGLDLKYNWPINEKMGCVHGTHGDKPDPMHVAMIPRSFIEYYERTVEDAKA